MFLENLPPQCPPVDSEEGDFGVLWRIKFSEAEGVNLADFFSMSKQGKVCPSGVDPCRWASCSLFQTEAQAIALKRLPKFKGKDHFSVSIMDGSGRGLRGSSGHVDFWFYNTVDPVSLVVNNG